MRTINFSPIPILLADDTSFLVADPNINDFRSKLNYVFNIISKWFMINLLSPNLKHITCSVKVLLNFNTTTIHDDVQITTVSEIKFLGIYIYIYIYVGR